MSLPEYSYLGQTDGAAIVALDLNEPLLGLPKKVEKRLSIESPKIVVLAYTLDGSSTVILKTNNHREADLAILNLLYAGSEDYIRRDIELFSKYLINITSGAGENTLWKVPGALVARLVEAAGQEQVHKPKHWFLKYYVEGEERRLDNNDTMGIAVACTANVAKERYKQLFGSPAKDSAGSPVQADSYEWHKFIKDIVSYYSSYCYRQRAGQKDDPMIELGKAANYDNQILKDGWLKDV